MEILENLNKNNLHHAYLIEGAREEIIPKIFKFMEDLGIKTSGNPDFCHISLDSFKIEDAHNLKSVEYEKSFSTDLSLQAGRKIFVISANNFLLEAQNALLKIFEDPIENTHFFLIVPNKNILLKTLISRFYVIETNSKQEKELKEAEKFILMPLKNRIDFIKELLIEPREDNEIVSIDSTRSMALKFLNALEFVLNRKTMENFSDQNFPLSCFTHFFKVREFVNQPGSSLKSLMESVALITPSF